LSAILGSPEYYSKCGSTPEGFLTTLFQDLLGRAPTSREFANWRRYLDYESNQEVAYAVLLRHPESWGAGRRWHDRDEDRRDIRRRLLKYWR
jgi:hypothetical protein